MMVKACKCNSFLLNECSCIHSIPKGLHSFYFTCVNNNNIEYVDEAFNVLFCSEILLKENILIFFS